MGVIATEILIVLLLILVNGLFSMSEMAIVSARKTRLQQQAEEGARGAQAALELSEEPTRFLSTVQVGITLIGILSGAFGGATIADKLAARLEGIAWLAAYSQALSVGLVVLAITYLSLVVGELVPKRVALNNAESIARRVARPMQSVAHLFTPVVSLLSASTDLAVRLLHLRPSSEPDITEEEIKLMIYEGARTGIFEESEQEIMARVFRLDDRKVGTLMTYRTEMVWLDLDDPLEENLQKMVGGRYTDYLLCQGTPDNVLGVVRMQDIFTQAVLGQPVDLQAAVRPALFIPESTTALDLLERLRSKKDNIGFIVDEYGGLVGLVTLDDILEAIVGEMPAPDEGLADPRVVRREDGSLLIDGVLSVEELKDLLNLDELPEEDESGYETLGGMIMTGLGRIPAAGDVLVWQNLRFEVMDMDGYRVDKVLVTYPPGPPP